MLACVAPGPRVTRQTAARPASFPAASAMFAAAASCLVVTSVTGPPGTRLCSYSASSTGRKLSPGTHVHNGTSCASRHCTSRSPPRRATGGFEPVGSTVTTFVPLDGGHRHVPIYLLNVEILYSYTR